MILEAIIEIAFSICFAFWMGITTYKIITLEQRVRKIEKST